MTPLAKIKLRFIALGIFIGFIVGGSATWWYITAQIGHMPLSNKLAKLFNKPFENESDSSITRGPSKDIIKPVEANPTIKKQNRKSIIYSRDTTDNKGKDSLLLNPTEGEVESITNLSNDSLFNDSLEEYEPDEYSEEDIVVIKDELLFTKTLRIEELDSISANNNKLDSLLLEDENPVKNSKNIIRIEFWRSPVNYRGYKMWNNKLILYGVYDFERTTVEYTDNKFYLLSNNDYYKLESTEEFLPLLPSKRK